MHTVSLIGPMGSGKSEIGRVLAARLGWEFIDTDAQIEAREGRLIADIFRDAGEPHFRLVERSVVGDAVRRRDRVISTGGGAILCPITRQRLVRAGPVFYLRVPIDVLLERVGSDPDRPLLGADPRTSLERLVREREALYAETGVAVEAARPVDAVVEEILGRLSGAVRRRVRVALGDRSYEVVVGAGVLPLAGFDLERLGVGGRLAIVTHRVLVRRFGTALTKVLQAAGCAVDTITVPAGERAKRLRQASRVLDALSGLGLTRSDTILALGGGVVGDLAGFVAGIYMRGVRLVHVPTTLLAQIDSSIGGKTAVNHPRAKNLIGVYHQPALVISDVETLASLPVRERRAGLAEVVKYGMVLDRELFEMLERDAAALSTGKARSVEDVVYRCAVLKAGVVAEDEFERGPREVLNYGHTVGHAIEAAMPGRLVHGEAVAVGMRVEARIAVRLGLLDAMAADRQDALLAGLGLPTIVPAGSIDALLGAMQLDKKRLDGRIRCSLPEGIGRARLGVDVPDALMEEVVIACQGSS
ncbi:MAG: 3-dehydroquinate synthase [Armatimonadota bacterium]